MSQNPPRYHSQRAVVVGASMAGLCAARVLAEHFADVLVLDRDDLSGGAVPRTRVPQGRQPHLLLNAGVRLLEGWFPGFSAELSSRGAVEIDLYADFLWHQSGAPQRRPVSSLRGPSMSRPLLEEVVRRRVAALPNVEIQGGVTVSGLEVETTSGAVTGVRLDDGSVVDCALVIDATGRQARSLPWLERLGFPAPRTTTVSVDTTYVSQRFRRRADPARDWRAAAVIDQPDTRRLCMALPIEGDEWIVMVAGVNGEAAPTEPAALVDYARSLPSSVVADLMLEPTGPVVTHRTASNQRRHVEKLRRFPLGWLLLGDAVCSFDPIYGQGMTSAALQADALAQALRRARSLDAAFSRRYFRGAAAAVAAPWSIAVGGDFVYPGTTGPKPPGTDLLNRYTDQVILAGQRDDAVVVRFNEVISLVRSPGALLSPAFIVRVLVNAARARRELREEGTRPAVGATA